MKYLLLISFSSIYFNSQSQNLNDQSLDKFWTELKTELTEKDSLTIVELISFPLSGGQYFIGRYNQEGLTEKEFINSYSKIFTPALIEQILKSSTEDLKTNPSNDNEHVFVRNVHENDEEHEYGIAIFISKINNKYSLTRIDLAG